MVKEVADEKTIAKLERRFTFHDKILTAFSDFLRSRNWKVIETHRGNEPGPDILAVSPKGKIYIFECEFEHASSRKKSQKILDMIKIRKEIIESVIFIGGTKNASEFEEICNKNGIKINVGTLRPSEIFKINYKKLKSLIANL